MIIRKAKINDLDELLTIGNSVSEFKVNVETSTFWPRDVLDRIIKSENNPLIIAEDNNEICGFIISNYNPTFKKAIIENVYVIKERRGEGIADKLLNQLITELKALGCEYVVSLIETETSDNPVEFYKRNGFSRGIDCVWMDLVLDDEFSDSA